MERMRTVDLIKKLDGYCLSTRLDKDRIYILETRDSEYLGEFGMPIAKKVELASIGRTTKYDLAIYPTMDDYKHKEEICNLLLELIRTREPITKPLFELVEGTYLWSITSGGWATTDVVGTISIETTWNKKVALEATEEEIAKVYKIAPWLNYTLKQV